MHSVGLPASHIDWGEMWTPNRTPHARPPVPEGFPNNRMVRLLSSVSWPGQATRITERGTLRSVIGCCCGRSGGRPSRGRLGAIEGLRRSRRLQAEIRHPHILPIIDFFEWNGEWFSVFASAPETQSLAEVIASITRGERPPLSISEFVALSGAVTDGLAAVHRLGFVTSHSRQPQCAR